MHYQLDGFYQYEEDIKKSRFLALAGPIGSAEEAMAFIQTHHVPDATHNCWAYKLGDEYRFNDDGEPGGTAGRPMLQAIEGQDCDRVVVLVIRWFGGVKLGTGGLMRAYGGVAASCLRLAPKSPIVPLQTVQCSCDYSDSDLVRSRFAQHQAQVLSEVFGATGVEWTLALPLDQVQAFEEGFSNWTRGQGFWSTLEKTDSQSLHDGKT
ncbi:putative YigZ family protein [Paenalcaligenes hominis]|uniref:YigZ family protein n=1 Tax=Paenalcaligenes hominis TaxID=643674 RepID=A0ABX0WME7_9BURK|nr:YigZ family protein [Paenalcaligenes hominis]NJB64408.1 putative YigZ family protein [Paenalcaligenes hominis]GGE67909.1 thymidylate synthase [Paenalcaligenes hominis]